MDGMDDVMWADSGEKDKEKSKAGSAPLPFNSPSPISAVLSYWKDPDSEHDKSKADGQRTGEHQEAVQKNRRRTLEGSRDAKRAVAESKKGGENALLNMYQKLFEAEPEPEVAAAAETSARVIELETENRKMKQELEEFRAESAYLTNQQATIRRLEERNRQLEQQLEEKVKEAVEMQQRTFAEENMKNLEIFKDRERSLQSQLRTTKDALQNMQQLHDSGQSQLFELRAQTEEERAAKQAELTLLTDEIDKAQSRLLSVEREKDQLRAQLHTLQLEEPQLTERLDSEAKRSLEASLTAKEKIISDLQLDLRSLESTLTQEREQNLTELRNLNVAITEKENLIVDLQKELSERPTFKQVDDLRRQVKILQAVGYNSVEAEEDWDAGTHGEDMGKLETLFLDKNRKMEHELTKVKVELSEKSAAAEAAEALSKELEAQVEEQKKLITKLEEDILKGYGSTDKRPSKPDDWELLDSGITDLLEPGSGKQTGTDDDQNSMLDVICSQRDRFRQRLRLAEEELRVLSEKCRVLTAELATSRADNVKLYEKMRYIQDYTQDRPQIRALKKRGDDVEAGLDVESKYKKMYEDDINPFTQFSRKEKERRYKELGLRDKITLTSGRFFLGNKYARTFIFFYSIALHLLVFSSLYSYSSHSYFSVAMDPKNEVEKYQAGGNFTEYLQTRGQ